MVGRPVADMMSRRHPEDAPYSLVGSGPVKETSQESALVSDAPATASILKRSADTRQQLCAAIEPAKCHVHFVDGTYLYSGLCRLPRRPRRERVAVDEAMNKCAPERQALVPGAPQVPRVVTTGSAQNG